MDPLKRLYLATYKSGRRHALDPGIQDLGDFNFQWLKLATYWVDEAGFSEWKRLNDWEERFPEYAAQWTPPRQPDGTMERKLSEHYVSVALGGLDAIPSDAIIIDVAAAGSPFYKVLTEMGYTNVYRTDLNYDTRFSAKKIGGAGSRDFAHFPDGSVHLIVAHNSIEHFERGEDLALFRQIDRILTPGGRFVWIPLGLTVGGLSETDPECWTSKYRNARLWPRFDRKYPVLVSDRRQRLMKWWDPLHLDSTLSRYAPNCEATIYETTNAPAGRFCCVLERRA